MAVGAVLVIFLVLAIVVFRGCHDREVEREMLQPPAEPLPGTEEVQTPAAIDLRPFIPRS